MIQIDKELIKSLFDKAEANERRRMNYDLRTSADDGSQRMLNALLPGTVVPIHRHPNSTENVFCLCGKLVEVIYEVQASYENEGDSLPMAMESRDVVKRNGLVEKERIVLDPANGCHGCVVPAGVWHTVEVLEPSVIYEAKDGAYGRDGSESYDPMKRLKEQITYLIGMERHSGSMEVCTPQYVSRMLHMPLDQVEKAMQEMGD